MIGSTEAYIVAVTVILFITLFGITTINPTKKSIPKIPTNDQIFQMKLAVYGIHSTGIIALGTTIFAVGVTLWVTSFSMLGTAFSSGSNNPLQIQIINAMLQLSSEFSISGFIIIVLGFVVPWYRLEWKKRPL